MSWNNYKSPNLGLLFYKHIYKESLILRELKTKDGALIIDVTKDHKPNPFNAYYNVLYNKPLVDFIKIDNPFSLDKFSLKTTYPGLLCGSGYAHDTGAMGDFKIGFYFDHTTGQPVIPGSSVKGVCRSVFEMERGKNTGKKSVAAVRFILEEILDRHKNIENFTLRNKIEAAIQSLPDESEDSVKKIKRLVEQIFGKDNTKGSDIFFDAVLDIDPNNSNPFLANDFITPHKHPTNRALDPFTNPNPIQFLKVRSEVPFEFRFKIIDFDEVWTKEVKLELFKQILLTLGIGAKTNVGYGQFSEVDANKTITGNNDGKKSVEKKPGLAPVKTILDEITKASDPVAKQIKNGSEWVGEIVSAKNDNFLIVFKVGEEAVTVKKKANKLKNGGVPEIGKKVIIKFNDNFVSDPPNFTVTLVD
jgi:CRISPR-associated protein Cmr6